MLFLVGLLDSSAPNADLDKYLSLKYFSLWNYTQGTYFMQHQVHISFFSEYSLSCISTTKSLLAFCSPQLEPDPAYGHVHVTFFCDVSS
jgi:hypothetical protein